MAPTVLEASRLPTRSGDNTRVISNTWNLGLAGRTGVVPDIKSGAGPAFCPSDGDPCGTLRDTYVPSGAPRAHAARAPPGGRVQCDFCSRSAGLGRRDADPQSADQRSPPRGPGVRRERGRLAPALGDGGGAGRKAVGAGARPLSRAHALQGHDPPGGGIRGPRDRRVRGPDQRGHVARLHLLPHPPARQPHRRRYRDARRHRRELHAPGGPGRAREARGARGDAPRRGQPAPPSVPAALRDALRRSSLRPAGDRDGGAPARSHAGDARELLPSPLRPRVVRAGRGGPCQECRGPGHRRADVRASAAYRVRAPGGGGAAGPPAEEAQRRAPGHARLPRAGLARSKARSRRHAGRRPARGGAGPGARGSAHAGPPRANRPRHVGERRVLRARGGGRCRRDRSARPREPGAGRGGGPQRDSPAAGAGGDRGGAAPGRHGRGSAARVLVGDGGRPRVGLRAGRGRLAARGRAGLHQPASLGHGRADPRRRAPLPRPRAVHAAGARAQAPMRRQATLGAAARAALVLGAAPIGAETRAVTRHELPNAMTVLVRENSVAPVVAVSLQVRAGSRFETAETAGITNLLLRSMIRGSARRSAVQLAEAAEEIGGSVDASGEVEVAEIRGEALARHWEALLGLVAEVTLEPALAVDEIEKERRLVLSQIRTRGDMPCPLSFDTVIRDLYGEHPYGRPSLGLEASVARLSRDALLGHYQATFRPERMVLAVSGQVSRERVVKLAERLFSRLARAAPAPMPAGDGPAPTGGRRVVERPAQQAQILMGYLGPGLNDPTYPAVRVLGAVLGGGMAGRLFVEIRDRRGLAYSLGVLTPYRTGPAFFVTYLGTARQNVAAAEAAALEELERVRTAPVGAGELARAKAYVLGNLAMDRRTNARRAWYLAFFGAVGAGWDFPDRYARAVDAVSAADVVAAAQRYLRRPTIVLLQPQAR